MSAQNNLKKPAFTKIMLGYNPKEVDQYIEYITERYAAVSRDVSELRRRVSRLQFELDSIKEQSEPEVQSCGFTDAALDRLRYMIEAERSRHEEALNALVSFIDTHSHGEDVPAKAPPMDEPEMITFDVENDDNFVPLDDEPLISDADAEWQEVLESFISDAEDVEPAKVEDESAEYADAEAVFAAPISGAYLENTDTENTDTAETTTEPAAEAAPPETAPERKKTPAELAAELDFYSDNVVRDGESYDPMTLAQSSTMKRRRPTLEDFMKPMPDNKDRGDR